MGGKQKTANGGCAPHIEMNNFRDWGCGTLIRVLA